MSDRTLKLGALKCPTDKESLHFECMGGMRMKHQVGKGYQYKARCPKCATYYNVTAPGKEQ